jgi:cytochrome c biogenesis protein CcdA
MQEGVKHKSEREKGGRNEYCNQGGVALPAVFAVGTGLPVLVFGTLISLGVARVSAWLSALNRAEKIIRVAVSIIFIGVGIYYVALWVQT